MSQSAKILLGVILFIAYTMGVHSCGKIDGFFMGRAQGIMEVLDNGKSVF